MEIGDIVKVKRGMMIVIDNKRTCISAEDRFVVIDTIGRNVVLKYMALGCLDKFSHGVEFLLGKSSVEVVGDAGRPLGKVNFNESKGEMPKGRVVKIRTRDLADAQEWAQNTGYHTTLNDNEHFVVTAERTKTVCIKSKERDWLMYLPKRFLEEVLPERIELNKQDILTLIDLTLDTGDKEWFNELHSKLSALA